jgi:hypothetical protein
MLLLPSLIKMAIGASELPYQVAPGLAVAAAGEMLELGEVARSTCFLPDGDTAGRKWRAQLIAAGIDAGRILQMPEGWAVEDFLSASSYIDAVFELLDGGDALPRPQALAHPFKRSLTGWLKRRHLTIPGPVAIAEHLIAGWAFADTGTEVTLEGTDELRSLDRQIRLLLD